MANDFEILAYPVADLRRVAGIGRTKTYELIAEGKIEARQCGGRTLIPAASLRAYLDGLPPAPVRRRSNLVEGE